jgi:hypothetical protein
LQWCIFPALFPHLMADGKKNLRATREDTERFFSYKWQPGTLMSLEDLSSSGSIVSGSMYKNFVRFVDVARLYKSLRILFVVREHQSWLASEYVDRLKKSKVVGDFAEFASSFSKDDLSWSKRIKMLQELDCELLLMKDTELKNDPFGAAAKIVSFYGLVHINKKSIERRVKSFLTRKNRSPKTMLGIKAVRFVRSYSLLLEKELGIKYDRQVEDIVANVINRFNIGRKIIFGHLDRSLKIRLESDWQNTMRLYKLMRATQ